MATQMVSTVIMWTSQIKFKISEWSRNAYQTLSNVLKFGLRVSTTNEMSYAKGQNAGKFPINISKFQRQNNIKMSNPQIKLQFNTIKIKQNQTNIIYNATKLNSNVFKND